jgi:hypothetical protein
MNKHSTLLYWINDFDLHSKNEYNPVIITDDDDTFLSHLLNPLIIDPGEKLVKKVMSKL